MTTPTLNAEKRARRSVARIQRLLDGASSVALPKSAKESARLYKADNRLSDAMEKLAGEVLTLPRNHPARLALAGQVAIGRADSWISKFAAMTPAPTDAEMFELVFKLASGRREWARGILLVLSKMLKPRAYAGKPRAKAKYSGRGGKGIRGPTRPLPLAGYDALTPKTLSVEELRDVANDALQNSSFCGKPLTPTERAKLKEWLKQHARI